MGVAPRRYAEQKAAASASPAPVVSTSSTGGAAMTCPSTLQPAEPRSLEPLSLEVVCTQANVCAALRKHRSLSGWTHQDRDGACWLRGPDGTYVDSKRLELRDQQMARVVVTDPRY